MAKVKNINFFIVLKLFFIKAIVSQCLIKHKNQFKYPYLVKHEQKIINLSLVKHKLHSHWSNTNYALIGQTPTTFSLVKHKQKFNNISLVKYEQQFNNFLFGVCAMLIFHVLPLLVSLFWITVNVINRKINFCFVMTKLFTYSNNCFWWFAWIDAQTLSTSTLFIWSEENRLMFNMWKAIYDQQYHQTQFGVNSII